MAYESNSIFWVEVEKIVPNPFQPRREFDQGKLKELSESVRMYGVLQPLVVTRKEVPLEDGAFRTEYELIAGERRLRASKLAGLSQVPVIIRSGEETELMKLELAIIENLQREDLNPVDRAMAFSQLASAFGLSHTEVAKKVGRSREYVSNSIRLLQLPDTILSALSQREISDGHARTLLMLNDRPEEQDVVFREILLKKLSVREVEKISRKIATDKVRKKNWVDTDPELIEIEKQFTESLGTRVQISKTDYGGKIVIDYFSPEDLQKLLDMVHKEERDAAALASALSLSSITAATPLEEVHSPQPVGSENSEEVNDLSKEWETDVVDEEAFAEPIPVIDTEGDTDRDGVEESSLLTPIHAQDLEENKAAITYSQIPTPIPSNTESYTQSGSGNESEQSFVEEVAPHVTETNSVAEIPVAQSQQQSIPNGAPTQPEEKREDDDTLYSLKNFSL